MPALLTTIERVRMLGDEFIEITAERLTMYIEDASLEVSSLHVPDEQQERLARYLSAHLAVVSQTTARAVIREKLDVIERQYADTSSFEGLLSTKYGQEYRRLLSDLEAFKKSKKGINLMVF